MFLIICQAAASSCLEPPEANERGKSGWILMVHVSVCLTRNKPNGKIHTMSTNFVKHLFYLSAGQPHAQYDVIHEVRA